MNNYTVKEDELLFAKVRPEAIIPSKDDANAGFDIYACFEEDYMIIPAFTTRLIPTGIASAINQKYYLQIEERGSTGSKGIKKSCGVIDSGYRGEWFIAITNSTNEDIIISKLSKEELADKHGLRDDEDDTYIPYKNERIFLKFNDGYESDTIIYPYEKAIAQAVVHEVPVMNVGEIDYEDLKAIPSDRGTGALGSSGK
jgi:dUTP pyrophosphatase